MNTVEARTASFPAFGGIGTACSFGKFYRMLAAGGTLDGNAYIDPETIMCSPRGEANAFAVSEPGVNRAA